MQLTRFVQIILLRDVLMYIFPGSIFGILLCTIGFDQTIAGYTKYIFDSFGQFLGASILLAISYSIGYIIYTYTTVMVRRLFKIPSNKELILVKKNDSKKERNSSLDSIEDDLITKVSQAVGKDVIADWGNLLREEIESDPRGLRYLRYICEMQVMEKYPEIHHITIERRSSLKNFQTSLSGVLILVGVIGITEAVIKILTKQPGIEIVGITGTIMLFFGILLFRSLEKMEQELRISIWRAFHAMSLMKK